MKAMNDNEKLSYLNNYLKINYKSLNDVRWGYISYNYILSEDFIREFSDKVDWYYISKYQTLSENFIREMKDKVYWSCISMCQTLSEEFIREMKDEVDWFWISVNQKLSEPFIIEFRNYLNWGFINKKQKLSPNFFTDLEKNCEDFRYTWIPSWKELTIKQKKNEIINTNLYECHDNHFIAYKAVRKDRSSWYAPERYTYLEGESYTSNADYSNEENSFGLSVWTEEGAKEFGNENLDGDYLLLKIEVHYEDVARLVHDENKIRCTKFKVIS